MEPQSGMDGDMGDTRDDDFELEVSDLRTGRVLDTVSAARPTFTPAAFDRAPDLADDDDLTITSLDTDAPVAAHHPFRLPTSPRARRILIIGLALLLCLAIFLNLPGVRQGFQQIAQGSTPSVAISQGGDMFYLVNVVPWGSLTADGKPVRLIDQDQSFILSAGKHMLQYSAAPFAPVRCQVTVPEDLKRDTCPLTTNSSSSNGLANVRVIDLGLTPDKLPAEAYDALLLHVSTALVVNSTTSALVPGDHYLGPNGATVVATTPLVASLALALNLDPSRPSPGGLPDSSCDTFCAGFTPGGVNSWTILAHVLAQWHFTTTDGTYVPSSGAVIDTTIELSAAWENGEWTLAPVTPENNLGGFCSDAFNNDAAFLPSGDAYVSAQAPNPVDGCLEVVSASNDVNPPSVGLPADAALYIYRFGVILAGNQLAHQQQPQLPVATDRERILALQWFEQ